MKKTIKKNFKKLCAMVTASVLAVFVMSFASCAANVDDSKDDKPKPTKTDADETEEDPKGDSGENKGETHVIDPVIAKAIEKIFIPEVVDDEKKNLKLPASVTVDETSVTVAWSSGNTSIINNAGIVTPQTGEGEDTVTLTAVFMYNGITETKEYTVKVYRTSTIRLASALKQVKIEYKASEYAYETIQLPKFIDVDKHTFSLSYKSSDRRSVKVFDNNDGLAITKDLVAKTVTVTAEVHYSNSVVSKDFTLEIPAFTNFQEDFYDGNDSTIKTGDKKVTFDMENKIITILQTVNDGKNLEKRGNEFSFEFGKNPGQLILTPVKYLGRGNERPPLEKDKWYTRDELLQLYEQLYGPLFETYDALMKNPPETYADLKTAFNDLGMDDEDFAALMKQMGAEINDDEKTQKEKISGFIPSYCQAAMEYGFAMVGAKSYDEYIEFSVNRILGLIPDGTVFEYEIPVVPYSEESAQKRFPTGGNIYINALHDSKKGWFDQCGTYSYYNSSLQKEDLLRCGNTAELQWEGKEFDGKFNEDYTKFTSNGGEEYTITDKKNGTVTLSHGNESHTLEFIGAHL